LKVDTNERSPGCDLRQRSLVEGKHHEQLDYRCNCWVRTIMTIRVVELSKVKSKGVSASGRTSKVKVDDCGAFVYREKAYCATREGIKVDSKRRCALCSGLSTTTRGERMRTHHSKLIGGVQGRCVARAGFSLSSCQPRRNLHQVPCTVPRVPASSLFCHGLVIVFWIQHRPQRSAHSKIAKPQLGSANGGSP
jgi:hypothetical protein